MQSAKFARAASDFMTLSFKALNNVLGEAKLFCRRPAVDFFCFFIDDAFGFNGHATTASNQIGELYGVLRG